MATAATLAAAARGYGGGEEKREGSLDADGGRRETVVGRHGGPNSKREQGEWPRSSARKEPTRRALRRWSERWSETKGQREEAAVAGGSTTTGRKKAVLAMEAVMMNEDGDGFTGMEGEVERQCREERAEAAVVTVVGAEEQGRAQRGGKGGDREIDEDGEGEGRSWQFADGGGAGGEEEGREAATMVEVVVGGGEEKGDSWNGDEMKRKQGGGGDDGVRSW